MVNEEIVIVHVFGSDDNLKILGELLGNETGRKIMFNLMNTDMYTNEIAVKLGIRVSLVIHHLEKMQQLGLLEITEKKLVRKGKKHRFFKVNSHFFISVNQTKKEMEESGLLKRIFKSTIKFAVIGIAVVSVFIIEDLYIFTSDSFAAVGSFSLFVFPLAALSIGLIIERFLSRKKGKISPYSLRT